ncbi:DNA-3-methyladenine glycosylase [Roseivirga misakiensis]|uniref:Putative 3-methyladenine DNA glycosylase n=1 Tax=Roseivirga misakiensis TaxID=1563681 RepID=A0A1E5SZW4_9BACT|nr:DNA-3-methyladenine glycosylase [Roseivirga misakiensis]OEK04661.1 3-methyladenine DNA glycosylase [Roseivirga misakiensis]
MKLTRDFYERPNVVEIAKDVLGKTLHTKINGVYTAAIVTEVEAYAGRNDKACHANNGLRSKRTEVMYGQGGFSYVYLCYGIHHLFNIVTNKKDFADAILIRGVEPLIGLEAMQLRRNMTKANPRLSSGPGILSQALGIRTKDHYGLDLLGDTIWLSDGREITNHEIGTSPRIGVDYAGEDALKPWRFYIKDNRWLSKR